jgi:hypothetical protein
VSGFPQTSTVTSSSAGWPTVFMIDPPDHSEPFMELELFPPKFYLRECLLSRERLIDR